MTLAADREEDATSERADVRSMLRCVDARMFEDVCGGVTERVYKCKEKREIATVCCVCV